MSYHFCSDCVYYEDTIIKQVPLPGHPKAVRVKCGANAGEGTLYYNVEDCYGIKKSCPSFQPIQFSFKEE